MNTVWYTKVTQSLSSGAIFNMLTICFNLNLEQIGGRCILVWNKLLSEHNKHG